MALNYYDQLCYCFLGLGEGGVEESAYFNDTNTIESGELTRLDMKIPVNNNRIIIPCYHKASFEKELSILLKYPLPDSIDCIYLNIFNNARTYTYNRNRTEYKSAGPIIKAMFTNTYSNEGVKHLECNGIGYYGGKGLILYDNYEPLILFALEAEKVKIGEENKYNPIQEIIFINPRVLKEDDYMSKHVRTKLLTSLYCINSCHSIYRYNRLDDPYNIYTNHDLNYNFKIVIDDSINNFFEKPSVPSTKDSSDTINNFLIEHSDELIASL